MTWKEIKRKRWFKILSNLYVWVSLVFIIWMLFFDTNSWWFTHRELNQEIEKLEEQKTLLQEAIHKDKELLMKLRNDAEMEKFARETYYFKKENEEIFIITTDSLNKEENE